MLSLFRKTLGLWLRPRVSPWRDRQARPSLEPLQDRITPAVTLQNGQLVILGTQGNDVAAIAANPTRVIAILNGQSFAFNRLSVVRIAFVGDLGNDVCINTTTLSL